MTTAFYTQHELTAHEIRADEVRNAAIARNRAKAEPKSFKFRDPEAPANDAQKGKIWALLANLKRVDITTWQTASDWITPNIDTFTMEKASKTIDRLKLRIEEAGTPVAPTAQELTRVTNSLNADVETRRAARDKFVDVPDGYYAVMTDDNVLAFYRVSTWEKSGDRKVQVHASDELHLVRGWKSTDAILAKIRLATPPVAGKRFADEIGSCWRCGRTLTDETSRSLGIGPKCRTMM